MQKKFIFLEILILFFYLILPPMLKSTIASSTPTLHFSISMLFYVAIAIFLIVQYLILEKPSSKPLLFQIIASIATLILLFASATIIITINTLLGEKSFLPDTSVSIPTNCLEWLNLLTAIFSAALYEEAVYRVFLPFALRYLLTKKESSSKYIYIFIELISILFFALGHRYLGLSAVINAVIGGIILRLCFLITKNPLQCALSHSAYNLLAVLLSSVFVKIS